MKKMHCCRRAGLGQVFSLQLWILIKVKNCCGDCGLVFLFFVIFAIFMSWKDKQANGKSCRLEWMVDHVRKDTLRTSCKDKMTKNMENRIEGRGRSAINGIVIQRRAGSVGYHCGLYRLQSQIQFHHEPLISFPFALEVVIMYYTI